MSDTYVNPLKNRRYLLPQILNHKFFSGNLKYWNARKNHPDDQQLAEMLVLVLQVLKEDSGND